MYKGVFQPLSSESIEKILKRNKNNTNAWCSSEMGITGAKSGFSKGCKVLTKIKEDLLERSCKRLDNTIIWILVYLLMVDKGFPGGSDSKESACNVGDLCSIPGWGGSPGGGHGNPLQSSCPENPMDRGACGLQSMESQRVWHNWVTNTQTDTHLLKALIKKNKKKNT